MKGYTNTLYQLVGKTIKVKVQQLTGTGTNLRTEKFLVTRAYPHYVMAERTCENGYIYRECFNIGTLICEGIIRQKGGELND